MGCHGKPWRRVRFLWIESLKRTIGCAAERLVDRPHDKGRAWQTNASHRRQPTSRWVRWGQENQAEKQAENKAVRQLHPRRRLRQPTRMPFHPAVMRLNRYGPHSNRIYGDASSTAHCRRCNRVPGNARSPSSPGARLCWRHKRTHSPAPMPYDIKRERMRPHPPSSGLYARRRWQAPSRSDVAPHAVAMRRLWKLRAPG